MRLLLKGLKEVLFNFKEDLQKELGFPVRLFLFGSYAKGLFDAYSDLDLVVLVPHKKEDTEEKVYKLARAYTKEYDVLFSVLVFSQEELLQDERRLTFERLIREGKEIE